MAGTTERDSIVQYVWVHTDRSECRCGKCFDRGDKPDPTGHSADLVFFTVKAMVSPSADRFVELTRSHIGEFGPCDPLDGREHSYLEIGGWIGDQQAALRYMGLGALLGVFELLTPYSVFGPDMDKVLAMRMAEQGLVSVMLKSESWRDRPPLF